MNYSLLLKHKLQFAKIIRLKFNISNSDGHICAQEVVFHINIESRWFEYKDFWGCDLGVFENRLAVNTGSPIRKEGAFTHLNIFTIQQCCINTTTIYMRVFSMPSQKLAMLVSFHSQVYLLVSNEKRFSFVCTKLNKHTEKERLRNATSGLTGSAIRFDRFCNGGHCIKSRL